MASAILASSIHRIHIIIREFRVGETAMESPPEIPGYRWRMLITLSTEDSFPELGAHRGGSGPP